MQKILGRIRRACMDYDMIQDGDKIGVGVSGGKDSLALLKGLKMYSLFSKEKFEIEAITVDIFNGELDLNELRQFCEDLGVNLTVIDSNIQEILFVVRKEKNPCSLCAKMRRGALNDKAKELGCNKIALGHHADDMIETFFLSMFYEGRLSTFHPVSYMDRIGLHVIRPLIYVDEKDIVTVSHKYNFPVVFNPCPVDKKTQREYIKQLLNRLQKDVPSVKHRIHGALTHPERNNLLEVVNRERTNIKTKKTKSEK